MLAGVTARQQQRTAEEALHPPNDRRMQSAVLSVTSLVPLNTLQRTLTLMFCSPNALHLLTPGFSTTPPGKDCGAAQLDIVAKACSG